MTAPLEDPLGHDDDLTPRERRRRRAGDGGGGDDEGSVDEVGGLPEDLLGPVDEFTLSLSEDVVKAAMAMTSQGGGADLRETPPTVSARSAARGPSSSSASSSSASSSSASSSSASPESVPSSAFSKPADPRFAKARPGSRSLPAPRTSTEWSPQDPLTTGVVPGGGAGFTGGADEPRDPRAAKPTGKKGVGQYTSELMLDGLDADSAKRPVAGLNPPSERLPEVPMPQPDTSRSRRPGLSGSLRPRARPEPPPEPAVEARPRRREDPAPAAPAKSLEELLTLADEPPEREDTVSGTVDLLSSLGEAPPTVERSEPWDPALGREPTPLRRAAEPSTLTGALEPIDEPDSESPTPGPESPLGTGRSGPGPGRARPEPAAPPAAARAEPAPPPRPESAPRRPTAKARPRPEPLPEPSLPEPAPAAEERLSRPDPLAPDPLATRPIPRIDEAPAAPAPPAPRPPAADPPGRADREPAARPKGGKPRDDKPRDDKGADRTGGDAAVDAFMNEKVYREPILGWLATLIGTVVLVGMIFFAILVILWLLAR